MSLMAVFNCSFFIILILFLLIIGVIWIHFNKRINNQDITMKQMVRLITTMTQELSLLRNKVSLSFPEDIIDISEDKEIDIKEEKINVSDNETESDSNSDDSDEEDSDEEDSDEEESDKEEEVKHINYLDPLEQLKEQLKEKIMVLQEEAGLNIDEQIKEQQSKEKIVVLQEEAGIIIEEQDESPLNILEEQEEILLNNLEEVILEESEDEQVDKEEYRKMSLNKLKTLVLEKKLTTDVSKLKKNDLLTILGVDV
jgi:hypothetical protein